MKVVRGANQPFADYDEIDEDILESFGEFDNGRISYDELKASVGPEAAQAHVDHAGDAEGDREFEDTYESLFDNPEDF